MTLVDRHRSAAGPTVSSDAEALIREAKRRERRRRLIWLGVIVILAGGGISTGIALSRSSPTRPAPLNPGEASTGGPSGAAIVLQYPTELAVGTNGNLYIGDIGLDKIVERLPDGRFRVIAGDGRHGFSGDGGPAVDAELSAIGTMTFAKNGTFYFADGNRIRSVSRTGRISTVVGNGSSSLAGVINGTPALSASIGSAAGLTFGRDGDLYFTGGGNQVLRLTAAGTIGLVAPSRDFSNLCGILHLYPTELAFNGSGDLYVSTDNAYDLVELTTTRRVLCLGSLRRGGGSDSALASGPGGTVWGDWQNSIVRIEGTRVEPFLSFSRGTAPRVTFTFLPDDIAVSPNGTIYSDTIANNGWTGTTAVIAVSPDRHVTTLWAKNEPSGYGSL